MNEEFKHIGRLTTEQAAKHLEVTTQTLWNWRNDGGGPSYTQFGGKGGKVFYYVEDLNKWERSQRTDTDAVVGS